MSKQDEVIAYFTKTLPKLKEGAEQTLVPNGEITREWDGIPPDYIDAAKQFLNDYADVKNRAGKTRRVIGLDMQKTSRDGVWRSVRVETERDPNNAGLFVLRQALRQGYMTQVDWTEARIEAVTYANSNNQDVTGVANTTSNNPFVKYVILFPQVAPQYVNDIESTLRTTTITDPNIASSIGRQITLTGTWSVRSVTNRIEEDGSNSVLLEIGQCLFTIKGYTDFGTPKARTVWDLYDVPADQAQTIIDAFKAAYPVRSSAVVNRRDNNICDISLRLRNAPAINFDLATSTDCRETEATDFFFSVADPDDPAYAIPTDPDLTPGVTYKRRVSDNGDGTYDIAIITTTRRNQTHTYRALDNAAQRVSTELNLGTTETLSPIEYTIGGVTYRRRVTLNADCTRDVETDTITAKDQTSQTVEESPARTLTISTHTEGDALDAPSTETGKIKRNTNRPTDSGKYATEQLVEQPKDQTGTEYEQSPAKAVTTTLHTEGEALSTPTSEQGYIKRVVNRPTQAGNYETRQIIEQPRNQTSTNYSDSAAASSQTSTASEASSPVTGSASSGTIRRITNRPTEAGNYSTADEVITPKDQTSVTTENSPSKQSTETLHTENASALPTPEVAQGHIRRNSNTPTEAGNYRTVEQDIVPVDQTATSTSDSAAASSTRSSHTENASPVSGSASSGTIRRITNRPTEAGNYSTDDEVITPKDQTSTSYEESPARSSTVARHTENSSALTQPSSETGKIKRVTNRPTEAGNYSTELETVVPKDQTATIYTDSDAASSTTSTHTENSAQVTGSASIGTIRRITNRPTDAGNYQTADEVITPKNQTAISYSDSAAASSQTATATEAGSPVTGSASTGTIRRITNRKTEAGNYQTADEVITPKNQTASDAVYEYFRSVAVAKQTEGTAQSSSFSTGTIVRVRNTPTEAGNYRADVETETPIARSNAAQAAEANADLVQSESQDVNQSSAASLPSSYVVGDAIVKVEVTRTDAGLYNNRTTTSTPTMFIGDWISYDDSNGTVYVRHFTNVPYANFGSGINDPLDGVTSDTNNILQTERNRFGLYSGTVRRQPDAGGGVSSASFSAIGEFLIGPMKSQDRSKIFAAAILYTTSKTDAQNYANGSTVSGKSYDTNAEVATALSWGSADTITHAGAWSTGVVRDRGTGRYRAIRAMIKVT